MTEPERAAAIRQHERWIETLTQVAAGLRQFETLRTQHKAHEIERCILRHQAEINRLQKLPPGDR